MRPVLRGAAVARRAFSTSRVVGDAVPLAYTRHDPPSPPQVERPPVLLMHGLFGSQRNNRTMTLARDLSRPVYTLDLRNHGDSPHAEPHDYNTMAADVESFVSAHNLPSPMLVGHSMGAKVAMAMALRRPRDYSAVVPVDNAPVDAALKSDFGGYVRAMREIEEQLARGTVTRASEADEILARYEPDITVRQFLLTNLVRAAGGSGGGEKGLRWRVPLGTLAKALPAMADFPFTDPERARFEGPTLVVRGSRSRYVADETLPVIGQFFPCFELLDIDSGHWVMSEKFEEFRTGLVEWVGRVVDRD